MATRSTPGEVQGDRCHSVDGELVRLPGLTCTCPSCGCVRWAGPSSSRATTTCVVVAPCTVGTVLRHRDEVVLLAA